MRLFSLLTLAFLLASCGESTPVSEKTYYMIPEGIDLDELTDDQWKQYEIAESEVPVGPEKCFVEDHSEKDCKCGSPPVIKKAKCDVYKTPSGKYCYTLCESCYVACNRP